MASQAKPHFGLQLIAAGLVFMSLWGCGKKGPPVVPRVPPLPMINDLQGRLQEGTVTLTWQHRPSYEAVSGYVVLRAQSALSSPQCPQCPLIFQKVGTLRIDRNQQTVHYSQSVPDGFRYTYKVQPFQSSRAQGPDSNMIVLEAAP